MFYLCVHDMKLKKNETRIRKMYQYCQSKDKKDFISRFVYYFDNYIIKINFMLNLYMYIPYILYILYSVNMYSVLTL